VVIQVGKKKMTLVLVGLIAVIVLFGGVKARTEEKPFSSLTVNDISEVTFSVNYYGTVGVLNEYEIKELVSILRKTVTYNQNNSHNLYEGGQDLTFNITKTDGTKINIMGHISTIVIDGKGYETKDKSLEVLHKLGSSLEWDRDR